MSKPSQVIRSRPLGALVLALALIAGLVAAPVAEAHSLFGNHDPNRPLIDYLTLGFGHMVGGWDHLLFIAGVVLLAGDWKRAAKLISLFVAGHSLTLLVATIAGWKLDAALVDVVIALSLVYVGVQGIRGRPESLRIFGAIVFAFGLAHGLGLSTRLQDLGLPDDGVVVRVVLFNIGVELGQLVALLLIAGIGTLLIRRLRLDREHARLAFGVLIATGLLAATLIGFAAATKEAEEDTPAAAQSGESEGAGEAASCTTADSQPPQFIGGGHPAKTFFGPDETAPEEDLVHVTGDGFVIVRYDPELPADQVAELEALIDDPASRDYVIGAPDPEQSEPLRAVTAYRTFSCTRFSVDDLTAFRDDWFAFLQAQQPGG